MPGHTADDDASTDETRPTTATDVGALLEQVQELEAQVDQLQQAAESRQQVGFACGVLAARYGLSPEAAWALLVRLSQTTNIKVRDIARVVHADLSGGVRRDDRELAERLNDQIDGTVALLSTPAEPAP